MPGMNRKGQQQPFRKGTARQPGAPLSAALAGRAAPGLASGMMDQQRQLAAKAQSAGKLSEALAIGAASVKAAKPKAKLSAELSARTYTSKGEINQTGNERAGQDFATFTKAGRPGYEFHEYVGADGKKKTVGVRTKR